MSGSVLITGGSVRIGAVLARGLAKDGWRVIIHYNSSASNAKELAREINDGGGQGFIVQGNLADQEDLASLMERATQISGAPLTALINNASTFSPDHTQDFTRETYDHHMDVNLFAALALSRDFAAQLPQNTKGAIINMIDQRVFNPAPDFFTYSVSKAGLYWATKTMAQALAPNIRVNGVGPGPTLRNIHQNETDFDTERNATLLGDGSPPETILDAVKYLLGATSVTGQMIAVDGGQHLAN